MYCIIHQYGEMSCDWRPYTLIYLDNHKEIRIFTNKKVATKELNRLKEIFTDKNLRLSKIDIGIIKSKI